MNAVKIGMTIEEAAECTGIGRNTMRKLVDWGKLPVLKVGRKTIIRRDTLERFMTVNAGKISVELTAGQKCCVGCFSMFFQVAFVPLSPYPDRLFFFGWQAKARQIVFALQFIPKTVVFIINVLVHLEILQYNIFAHMSQFPDCHLFL